MNPATRAPAPPAVRTDREPFERLDWLLFSSVGLIWGSSFLLIAIGLEGIHPGTITFARVALGAATLMALPAARRKIDRADRRRVVALSFIWVAIPFTLFPLAEEHVNSAVTGLLNGATPIWTGIIGGLFFGRPSRGPQRMGLAVGFVGIALVSFASSGQGETALVGVLMVLAATFFYGIATNLAGPLQHRYGSVPVMGKMLAWASLWTLPFGLYGMADSTFDVRPSAAVLVLGAIGTGLPFALMATLVGRVGGPRAAFITYLIPIVSLVLGVVFLADVVRPAAIVGVALVIGGAVLASRREA